MRRMRLVGRQRRQGAGAREQAHSLITGRIRTVPAFAGTKKSDLPLSHLPSRLAELPALTSDQGHKQQRCGGACMAQDPTQTCTPAHAQPAGQDTSLCTCALRACSATASDACERGLLESRGPREAGAKEERTCCSRWTLEDGDGDGDAVPASGCQHQDQTRTNTHPPQPPPPRQTQHHHEHHTRGIGDWGLGWAASLAPLLGSTQQLLWSPRRRVLVPRAALPVMSY